MSLTTHTAAIRETLAELARVAATAGDAANANALNQAAYQVSRGALAHVAADINGDLLVPSKGDAGTIYRVGEQPCTCTAGRNGKPCWHAALFEGVQTARERAGAWDDAEIAAAPGVAATIAAITDAVHGLTDAEYADLVAQQDEGPAEDAWTQYRRAVEAGQSASWAPDWAEAIWGK